MFAPPISQQIARAQRAPAPAASCVQEGDGGNPANIAASGVGNRAPPHGGGASRGVLSSASDDDGGGSEAPRIARRCPGRTNEQTCFSSVSEKGRQRLQSAIRASGASCQRQLKIDQL